MEVVNEKIQVEDSEYNLTQDAIKFQQRIAAMKLPVDTSVGWEDDGPLVLDVYFKLEPELDEKNSRYEVKRILEEEFPRLSKEYHVKELYSGQSYYILDTPPNRFQYKFPRTYPSKTIITTVEIVE